MVKIIPLQDRILLRRIEAKKETASGLILSKEQNDNPNMFVVEEVGPLVQEKLGYELKQGDRVIKWQYSGDDIKIEGEENLTIVAAEYILAKVEA